MSFNQKCLEAHNTYRKKHGAPPMVLDPTISRFSQSYAEKIASAKKMEHSGNKDYGENLYYCMNSNPNYVLAGNEAVDTWYAEIKDYRFGIDDFKSGTGHFTQVVWKDSVRLGVGVAKNGTQTYVVCNYSPQGNWMGEFKKQVQPPQ